MVVDYIFEVAQRLVKTVAFDVETLDLTDGNDVCGAWLVVQQRSFAKVLVLGQTHHLSRYFGCVC